ncbi:hypothetical protein GGH97_004663, partial [Coemansia sp. RSA 475]
PDDSSEGAASPALSDKARGKRPDPGPASTSDTREQATTSTAPKQASPGQFQPSTEWVFSWLPDLPLDPIIAVLDALSVHVDRISNDVQRSAELAPPTEPIPSESGKSNLEPDQSDTKPADQTSTEPIATADPTLAIIHWLSSNAMTQAMPDLEDSMPEIRPRLQGMSPALVVWFKSLLWSMVYSSGVKPFGIWKNTHVRLFVIKSSQ